MPPARPAAPLLNPAAAARVRQLAAQAEHRRAIAEFHTRRAASQQARLDALLLETIAALASLFSQPGREPPQPGRPTQAWPTRPRQARLRSGPPSPIAGSR